MSDYTPTMAELKDYATSYSAIASEAEWDRALAAHDAAKRAEWEAEQGEADWEYGTALRSPSGRVWDEYAHICEADARRELNGWSPEDSAPDVLILVKRTSEIPAGPWLPVPDTGAEGHARHDLDRMGICRRCGQGITAREVLDGVDECADTRAEDEFAPGECDGSSTCAASIHIHGCFTPHRSDQCDSPDEYGHIDSRAES